MAAESLLFWFLALVTLGSALGVLFFSNPIYSVFSLIMTMVGVSALFGSMGAYFLAGVQLIVYAGAVLVLFSMIIMLFDLKSETKAFARGSILSVLKVVGVGLITGLVGGAIFLTHQAVEGDFFQNSADLGITSTKKLGELLLSRYVFVFEILGVLLLVVAVGAVTLARSRGGTHEQRRLD